MLTSAPQFPISHSVARVMVIGALSGSHLQALSGIALELRMVRLELSVSHFRHFLAPHAHAGQALGQAAADFDRSPRRPQHQHAPDQEHDEQKVIEEEQRSGEAKDRHRRVALL